MLLGVHCSIRNSLLHALDEARRKNCNTIQIFTKSPRAWRLKSIPLKEIAAFNSARKKLGVSPLVIHIPYLPNLATSDDKLYLKSTEALVSEIRTADMLKADYFIIHPGAYSINSTFDEGISRITDALNKAIRKMLKPGSRLVILLENVAGGGRRIGRDFKEIKKIIDGIKDKTRIGVCLDTAHLVAGGYDISDKKSVDKTIEAFDKIIGINYLKVIHLNDSKAARGSFRDRHEHIGKGAIGIDGFRAIVNHPLLKNLPFILETPKDTPTADDRNLRTVQGLKFPS